jgi:hypothetical protein
MGTTDSKKDATDGLCYLPARVLAHRLRQWELSALEVLDAYLRRIEVSQYATSVAWSFISSATTSFFWASLAWGRSNLRSLTRSLGGGRPGPDWNALSAWSRTEPETVRLGWRGRI